jgi:hypothetical protein
MREKSSVMKIIRALAEEAPLTIYAMAKKTSVAVSLVHRIVKNPETGLEPQIVKIYSEATWRTGLKRVEYILTFRGLVEYFNLLFEEKQMERSGVKRVVRKYGQFCDYPIFTEQKSLETLLGAEVYDFICSTASILKNYPPSIPITAEGVSGSLPAVIRSIKEGRPPMSIQQQEKILRYAFTLVFFELAAAALGGERIGPTPNLVLYKLVSETFKEFREALEQRLRGAEKLEDTLKKQFST